MESISFLHNPRQYVAFWFKKTKTTAKMVQNSATTFKTLYLDYREDVRAAKARGMFSGQAVILKVMEMAYDEYVQNALKKEMIEYLHTLRCKAPDNTLMQKWLQAMTGAVRPLDLAVMLHWAWLIKRKSLNMPVKHHIMPILYGIQGSGKSMGIVSLAGPYKDYFLNVKADYLEDTRHYQSMADNVIMFFDEMQKMSRTDVEVIKHQITTTINSYRPLYHNGNINVMQNCTMIGATNKPFNEIFNDTTGSRRFYEIRTLNKCDWSTVDSLDYKALWLGIDENKEHGFLTGELLEELATVQRAMTKIDDVELYIQERQLRPELGEAAQAIGNQVLYDDYVHWCTRQGLKSYDLPFFSKKLINAGIQRHEERAAGKRIVTFDVSSACDILTAPVLRMEKV